MHIMSIDYDWDAAVSTRATEFFNNIQKFHISSSSEQQSGTIMKPSQQPHTSYFCSTYFSHIPLIIIHSNSEYTYHDLIMRP